VSRSTRPRSAPVFEHEDEDDDEDEDEHEEDSLLLWFSHGLQTPGFAAGSLTGG